MPRRAHLIVFLLILGFNLLNYHLTYDWSQVSWSSFGPTFLNDWLTGLITWGICWPLVRYWMKRYDWKTQPGRRLGWQLISTLIIGVGVIVLLTILTSEPINGHPVTPEFFLEYVFLFGLEICLFNGVYILFELAPWELKPQTSLVLAREDVSAPALKVKQRKGALYLSAESLQYIYLQNGIAYIVDRSFRTYPQNRSLQDLAEAGSSFLFRANRQYLITRKSVIRYERMPGKNLKVFLHQADTPPLEIVVSRTKASAFKRWLDTVEPAQGYISP